MYCHAWFGVMSMIGVTGASGFIGAHLLAQLGDVGFEINLRALETPDALAAHLRENGCRTVVHLAGPLPGDRGADSVALELAQRVVGAASTLDECHIIFASSIRVHSRDEEVFGVNSVVAPFDSYGAGKAAAETVLLSCADGTHPVTVLRISSVQGVGVNGRAQGLISVFARQAASGGPITVMGAGDSIKDLVGIGTVLDVVGDCILQPPRGAPFTQIVPVGSGGPATVSEIAGAISNCSGVDIVHIDADPNDLSGYVDVESTDSEWLDMVETVWGAVKTEMGVA
jgi:nucleoside-diphosphate-sugar epimerase